MSARRVVVTGLGILSPVGNTVKEFWDSLVNGRSGIGRITYFDTAQYDCKIAGQLKNFNPDHYFNHKEKKRMDFFAQYAVAAATDAMKDAGIDMKTEDANRIGVLVGSGIGGLTVIEEQHTILLQKGPNRVSPFLIPMLIVNMAPGQISMILGCKGPNLCVATACATGNHAIGEALRIIQHGDADVMIAGGTEAPITPMGVSGFCALKALSRRNDEPARASRPFDLERDGFVMGEGAGVVILEELERAKKRGARIYCELVGYGITGDAYHMTAPAPDGEGAARCMQMSLKDAKISPDHVSYINAHGTSTEMNDKFETMAIKTVFGSHAKKVPVSSTKSMTGHLLGAAGGVEMAVLALAIKHDILPPTINYEFPDPDCDLDYVPNVARKVRVEVAMSNSLGFGGHNATLVARKMR